MIFKTVVIDDTIESLENAFRELDKAIKEGYGIAFDIKIKQPDSQKQILNLLTKN